MMGDTHVLGGATAWLAITDLARPPAAVVVMGTGVAVAAALAVDIDHRRAHAAHAARAAGGAAQAVGVMGGLAYGSLIAWTAAIAGTIVVLLPALTRPRHGRYRGVVHSLWGAGVVLAASLAAMAWWPAWYSLAVLAGWFSHLALDALTIEGLPLAWPSPARFGWLPAAHSIRTGGRRTRTRRRGWRRRAGAEYWLVQPALTAAFAACLAVLTLSR